MVSTPRQSESKDVHVASTPRQSGIGAALRRSHIFREPHTEVSIALNSSQLFLLYAARRGRLMLPIDRFCELASLNDRNRVVFRDQSRGDYSRGISETIPNMAAFLAWQEAQRAANFPHVRTTYCIGASSGAYAAIASGYFLKVPIVWIFSLPLLRTLPFRAGTGAVDEISIRCADLRRLLRDGNGVTEYRLFYNEHYSPDRITAESLAGCPGVRLFPQPGRDHSVVMTMEEQDLFGGLGIPVDTEAPDCGRPEC